MIPSMAKPHLHGADGHAADHSHERPAASALRAHGRRLTRQREAIWAVLTEESDAHLSADEVRDRVRARMPALNPSTVYRTLDVLVDDRLVHRTDLGADRAYFEPAHDHPHHHIVCECCGAVAHVHDEALGDVAARLRGSTGFVLGSAEVTFFGTCRECAESPAGPS